MSILNTLGPSALEVANYMIEYENKHNRIINQQKLIHMLYIAQGFFLVFNNESLFYDTIMSNEKMSIIIPSIIDAFLKYGLDPIYKPFKKGENITEYMWLRTEMEKECPGVISKLKTISFDFNKKQKNIIHQVCEHVRNFNNIEIANYNIKSPYTSFSQHKETYILTADMMKKEFSLRLEYLKKQFEKSKEEKIINLDNFR